MEAKQTAGPWEYAGPYVGDGANFADGDWGIYSPLGESGPVVALVNSEANARFIVLACDVHDELVAALEKAKEVIKTWHGDVAWEIYDKNAPEMKPINVAIGQAKKAWSRDQ